MQWTNLWLIVVAISTCMPVFYAFQLSDVPTDLIVSINGEVYVGAGRRLYRLHEDLSLDESILVTGRDARVQKMVLSSNESRVALCLSDGTCVVYDSDFMGTGFEEITRVGRVVIPGSSIAMVIASSVYGDTFYVGSQGQNLASDLDVILLGQYGLLYGDTLRSSEADFTVHTNSFQRDFIAGFKHKGFIYFIVMDNGTESSDHHIRILRVCDDPDDGRFSALYEAVLDCGTLSPETRISSFTSVDGKSEFTGVIGITGGEQNRVCSFNVKDIDREMLKTFQECSDGTNDIPLAWNTSPSLGSCSDFMEPSATECNFGAGNTFTFVTALATFRAVSGTSIINMGTDVEITATLALEIDSILLMYVGYSNDTGHFLEKYYVTDELWLSASTVITLAPVVLLRWIPNLEFVYAATANEVYRIPFMNCSLRSDCINCTNGDDPLCGWCVLEDKCSRKISCKSSELKGRWIQESNRCIANVQLFTDVTTVDSLQQGLGSLEVSLLPHRASFPELGESDSYYCLFTADDYYSFSAPLSGSVCTISPNIPWFNGTQMVMDFMILTTEEEFILFSIEGALTLYNCSTTESCGQCVQVSSVCGWCVYNQICAGADSLCRAAEDWIRTEFISESGSSGSYIDTCPVVLAPTRGHYVHPVVVASVLTVHTKNMPPPISKFKYECAVEFSSGNMVRLPVYFAKDNEEPITCQVSHNQIQLSSLSSGEERVKLILLWVSEDGQYEYQFEFTNNSAEDLHKTMPRMQHPTPPLHSPSTPLNMILYDCHQLAGCCSSCLATSIQTDYKCGWCFRASGINDCSIVEECISIATQTNRFTTQSGDCPLPIITSISPTSGPTTGGTTVTLTGSDLGIAVDDVVEVSFGASSCAVGDIFYIPGTTIVCNTTESDTVGAVSVTVDIQRNATIVSTNSFLNPHFVYAVPRVLSVFPLYGPKSGGTVITIKGAALNISNSSETKVKLAGVYCTIRIIKYTDIVCITQPRHEGSGLVQISIDAATLFGDGMEYTYTDDPIFYSVYPKNTIPVGGVTLTFKGDYLNVVQHPHLVITGENFSSTGFCRAFNGTTLHCVAPPIPDFTSEETVRHLNYTVVMDDAAGPSLDVPELQLTVKPNPVFVQINEEDVEYTGSTIRILGVHLDSVLKSEVQIGVNSAERCQIVSKTEEEIQCSPPDLQLLADAKVRVVVLVANDSLAFDVGCLQYRSVLTQSGSGDVTPTMPSEKLLAKSVVPVIATVACVVLLGVGIVVTVAFYRRTRMKRGTGHSRRIVDSSDGKQINLSSITNVYHGSPCDGLEENVYDVIPDYIIANRQVQPNENLYNSDDAPVPCVSMDQVDGEAILRYVHPRRRALPPTPSCGNDDYVEMRAHSVSSCLSVSISPTTCECKGNAPLKLKHQQSNTSEYTEMFPPDEEMEMVENMIKGKQTVSHLQSQ